MTTQRHNLERAADPDSSIYIVAATDNHYAILLSVLIKSIDANHRSGEKIELYVIDSGITKDNIKKLNSIADPSRLTIHFRAVDEVLPSGVSLPIDSTGMPQNTYMRIFAPYLVPATVEKVIYMDVDMVVIEDISKLWKTDLGDSTVGCVQDHSATVSCEWAGIPNYKELGLHPDTKYFNAGLLLINALRWREDIIPQKVLKCVEDNKKSLLLADQYALNVVFANKWLELDPRWNCKAGLQIQDPYIMHFIDIKPIYKSYKGNDYFRNEFYRYLKETPWKDFKPVGDHIRLLRKAFFKLKKISSRFFTNPKAV